MKALFACKSHLFSGIISIRKEVKTLAQNAKDIQLRELKDLLRELRETNQLLRKTLEEAQKEKAVLRQERDNFKEQVDYLTKKLFGCSSEKGACEIPGQMNLFNEAESEMDPSAQAADMHASTEQPEQTEPESRPRKKRPTNEERFKGIPVKQVYLEPSADECICRECGARMEKIGTEFVRRELEIIPARARVVEYYSVNYGCKNCRRNAALPNIVKGKDGKAHMMYGMASASTVAWVVYQKYCNGMPLYRIEQDLGRLGAEISRATLANWVVLCQEKVQVKRGLFVESMESYSTVFCDHVFQIIQFGYHLFTEFLNPIHDVFQQITQFCSLPNQCLHVFRLHPALPPFILSIPPLSPASHSNS